MCLVLMLLLSVTVFDILAVNVEFVLLVLFIVFSIMSLYFLPHVSSDNLDNHICGSQESILATC